MRRDLPWFWIGLAGLLLLLPGPVGRVLLDLIGGLTLTILLLPLLTIVAPFSTMTCSEIMAVCRPSTDRTLNEVPSIRRTPFPNAVKIPVLPSMLTGSGFSN